MGKKLKLVLNLSNSDIYDLDLNRASTESILFPKNITVPNVNTSVPRLDEQQITTSFSPKTNISFKSCKQVPLSQRFQLDNTSIFPVPKNITSECFEKWNSSTVKGSSVDKTEYLNYVNKMISFNTDSITDLSNYKFQDSVCWWCCHSIPLDTIPIGMPISYNEVTRKFIVKGIYCSFNCCLANVPNDYTCSRTSSLIYYMYKKCTANKTIAFKQAPPRQTLSLFGGILSIQEYREYFKTVNTLNISEYPLVFKNFDTTMTSLTLYKKNKQSGSQPQQTSKNKPKGNILDMFDSKNKLK